MASEVKEHPGRRISEAAHSLEIGEINHVQSPSDRLCVKLGFQMGDLDGRATGRH